MRALMILASLVLSFSPLAHAEDQDEIQTCLSNWKDHPFKEANPKFRVMRSQVKVVGIGGEAADTTETTGPELVLIKPAVSVMSKSAIRLLNPNGWYCLQNKVAVMSKSEIYLHCKAHLTSSNTGATVIGSDDNETGVTVLGKSTLTRVGCGKDGEKEKK